MVEEADTVLDRVLSGTPVPLRSGVDLARLRACCDCCQRVLGTVVVVLVVEMDDGVDEAALSASLASPVFRMFFSRSSFCCFSRIAL